SPAGLEVAAVRGRTETGVVEGDLFGRVDPGVGSDAAGAEELVDVGARLIEIDAARLTRPIGEDDNILRHGMPHSGGVPSRSRIIDCVGRFSYRPIHLEAARDPAERD